jgi:hypothetical protein
MGTLGKSVATGNIGGSVEQVLASANRFAKSSNSQLAQESQAIKTALSEGNLKNALFTSANSVSKNAQNVYNYVYTNAQNGTANAVKALPGAAGAASSFVNRLGYFIGGTIDIPILIMPVEPFIEELEDLERLAPQT